MKLPKKHENKKDIFKICILSILLISSAVLAQQVTREDAVDAIEQAETDIQEMKQANFSVQAVEDRLEAARTALRRADFAKALEENQTDAAQGINLSEQEKQRLSGLDYEKFSYAEVLNQTAIIDKRKSLAFNISDSIRAVELKLEDYEDEGANISSAQSILKDAKGAFRKERYEETRNLISEANTALEQERSEQTTLNILVQAGTGFFEEYWHYLAAIALALVLITWIIIMKVRIRNTRNRIEDMKAEKKALITLKKQAQTERFIEDKIPKIVYTIRTDKYDSRLNEIQRNLPVQKKNLKKLKRSLNPFSSLSEKIADLYNRVRGKDREEKNNDVSKEKAAEREEREEEKEKNTEDDKKEESSKFRKKIKKKNKPQDHDDSKQEKAEKSSFVEQEETAEDYLEDQKSSRISKQRDETEKEPETEKKTEQKAKDTDTEKISQKIEQKKQKEPKDQEHPDLKKRKKPYAKIYDLVIDNDRPIYLRLRNLRHDDYRPGRP